MIDIHCHILPGLDDGARDMAQSIAMAQIAAMDGITGIVCTPHFSPVFPGNIRRTVLESVERLQTKLREMEIQLALYPGSELAIDPNIVEKIGSGELLTVNDNMKVALIELPPEIIPPNLDRFFWSLQARGINTILAHPERCYPLMKNPSLLFDWVQAGVMVQLTGSSVMGHYGEPIRDFSFELLKHRMAHLVASDSHGDTARRPMLSRARAVTEEIVGAEEARKIFCEYPDSILCGEFPDVEPPIPFEKKKPFLRRFFRC